MTVDLVSLMKKYRTSVMGFAALWIYFFHEHILLFGDYSFIGRLESFIKSIGCDGVEIFFFLSGLGLNYAIAQGSVKTFYRRRIRRLVIPFVLVGVLRSITGKWSLLEFAGNVTGLSFYTTNIYSLLWFVPAIMTLYLLFPAYFHYFSRSRSKALFTVTSVAVWYIVAVVFQSNIRSDLFGFINRIPVFLVGVLTGWYTKNRADMVLKRKHVIVLFLLGFIGLYLRYQNIYHYLEYPHLAFYGIPSSLVAVACAILIPYMLENIKRFKVLNGIHHTVLDILAFYGKMSLEFYCLQEWIAEQVMPWMMPVMPKYAVNIVLFVIVTLSSFALHSITNILLKERKKV